MYVFICMPTQAYVTGNLVVIYNIPNEFIALVFPWMKLSLLTKGGTVWFCSVMFILSMFTCLLYLTIYHVYLCKFIIFVDNFVFSLLMFLFSI